MVIRPANSEDAESIWRILEPVIRAGETYPLPRDMSRSEALAYWLAPHHEVFVALDITGFSLSEASARTPTSPPPLRGRSDRIAGKLAQPAPSAIREGGPSSNLLSEYPPPQPSPSRGEGEEELAAHDEDYSSTAGSELNQAQKIVGTYYLRANNAGGGAHVANCGYMVAADATGRGVARAMCAHSLAHAKDRGFRAMQFNFVITTNKRAVRLWQAMGFSIVGRLPGAFLHPTQGYVDALVMYREL
jgi:ribosomal protein S18 acetylase RimI-like enzyme